MTKSFQQCKDLVQSYNRIITYSHVNGFWFKACQELSPEIDPLKVHINPSTDFKTLPNYFLEGNRSIQNFEILIQNKDEFEINI